MLPVAFATQEVIQLSSFLQDLNLTPRLDDPVEMLGDAIKAKRIVIKYKCPLTRRLLIR